GSGLINAYLVEENGEVTIIDAGLPGYWADLPAELAAMGRSLADVRAVVLTHGHTDHIGFAERARQELKVPVSVHEIDARLARGEIPNGAGKTGAVRIGPLLRFLVLSMREGGLRTKHLAEVSTFGDGATLDVPGSPRVILLPGHTPGSAAIHVPSLDALFAGDAMATVSVASGVTGPMLAPFSADRVTALASMARLDGVEAGWLLPGHGLPWTGGVQAAVQKIRDQEAAAQAR
ncbi:MAG TPA: MBL fold metallo-hydrolase, partial [Candidatus Limnocylindrales bacterium]|nr:MBL fold metallo-hydrolase [Candidatus Limnocylindrales bacterium]